MKFHYGRSVSGLSVFNPGRWMKNPPAWVPFMRDHSPKIKIKIEPHDTWAMDVTLSHIIVPMLIQLKQTKHGSPYVDDNDVPENLRSTAAGPKKDEWDIDEYHHARWDWVLGEMIWAMEQIRDEMKADSPLYDEPYDPHAIREYDQRVRNGCLLFGKYFMCLWD